MKKFVVSLLCCLLLCSCISQLLHPYMFPLKEQEMYDGKNTGLSSKLNIDGYYVMEDYIDSIDGDRRSLGTNTNLLFFEDGTFIRFRFEEEFLDTLQNMANIQLLPNIMTWHNKPWVDVQGYYLLKNDTIVTKGFTYEQFVWEMERGVYLIVDKNTIKLIEKERIYNEDFLQELKRYDSEHNINNTAVPNKTYLYHFYPATELPTSELLSIKRKKWFWKNKDDRKIYMRKRKEFLKKKKAEGKG